MITTRILMNSTDLAKLTEVVKENNLASWKLKQEVGSGIGYTTDIEFETAINGRTATVIIPVADSDNW